MNDYTNVQLLILCPLILFIVSKKWLSHEKTTKHFSRLYPKPAGSCWRLQAPVMLIQEIQK